MSASSWVLRKASIILRQVAGLLDRERARGDRRGDGAHGGHRIVEGGNGGQRDILHEAALARGTGAVEHEFDGVQPALLCQLDRFAADLLGLAVEHRPEQRGGLVARAFGPAGVAALKRPPARFYAGNTRG